MISRTAPRSRAGRPSAVLRWLMVYWAWDPKMANKQRMVRRRIWCSAGAEDSLHEIEVHLEEVDRSLQR